MNKLIRLTACSLLIVCLANFTQAQTAAGPPDWNDKASVYLSRTNQEQPEPPVASESEAVLGKQEPASLPPIDALPLPATPEHGHAADKVIVDSAVVPAATELRSEQVAPPVDAIPMDSRRLAPPSSPPQSTAINNGSMTAGVASRRIVDFGVPTHSLYTIGSALAIVIGAFLLFAYAIRRSSQRAAGRGQLPPDVVSVLGRVPLAARQFAELLRVGNKLVLVSLTPGGAETLTEVTDPVEVDRLVGLCQQKNKHSTTQAFEQVFQQMSVEPATGGFLGNEPMPSFASPAGAYRASRGGNQRA